MKSFCLLIFLFLKAFLIQNGGSVEVVKIDPSQFQNIYFAQSSVSPQLMNGKPLTSLVNEMKTNGFNQKYPVNLVNTGTPLNPGYTAIDTRRTVSAMTANVPLYAKIYNPSDKVPGDLKSSLYNTDTWGQAARERMRRGSLSEQTYSQFYNPPGPMGYPTSLVRVPKTNIPESNQDFKKAGFKLSNDQRGQRPKLPDYEPLQVLMPRSLSTNSMNIMNNNNNLGIGSSSGTAQKNTKIKRPQSPKLKKKY